MSSLSVREGARDFLLAPALGLRRPAEPRRAAEGASSGAAAAARATTCLCDAASSSCTPDTRLSRSRLSLKCCMAMASSCMLLSCSSRASPDSSSQPPSASAARTHAIRHLITSLRRFLHTMCWMHRCWARFRIRPASVYSFHVRSGSARLTRPTSVHCAMASRLMRRWRWASSRYALNTPEMVLAPMKSTNARSFCCWLLRPRHMSRYRRRKRPRP
mmetsp:Transcript_64924/g.205094  ORF Transcript_64924/g.205094 Transcript_64924/m.205094 type:complete len:217 (-) Transcript_64924:2075-2725(-)